MPEMMLSNVLLPEPDAPSKPTMAWSAHREIDILQHFEPAIAGSKTLADAAQADGGCGLPRFDARLLR